MPDIDSYVKLMCHFNGTDASTTIVDDYGGKTITVNGNAQLDTAQKKFGTASLLLDGNGDFLSIADNADFNYSSNDFTIDFQVRINTLPTAGNSMCLFAQRATATSQNSLGLFIRNNSGKYQIYASFSYDGTTEKLLVTDYVFTINTWYHIAICRNGNWMGLFVDGVNIGNYFVSTNALHNSTAEFKIGGSDSTTTNYFNGWIDEFRLSNGVARYTISSYIPATSEYTADSNDLILLHMDGTNDSTTFTDSSSGLTPKFGTGMAYFDGNGDYISIPSNSDFSYGTGDFTIDFWVMPLGTGTYVLFDERDVSNSPMIYLSGGNVSYYANGGFRISGGSIPTSNWSHIAIVRSGTSTKLYINGTQSGSTYTDSTNYGQSKIWLGRNIPFSGDYYYGFMDEVRVSKGTARWTSNFTPPTGEYSSDSNTQLLLHCDGTNDSTTFTDSGNTGHTITANGDAKIKTSYPRTIIANGNTKIKTAIKKFGTGSAYFDGNGDSLSFNMPTIGISDLTIDLWMYRVNINSNDDNIIDFRSNVEAGVGVYFIYNNGIGYVGNGGNYSQNSGGPIVANEWHHISIVRESNIISFYVDGYLLYRITGLTEDYNYAIPKIGTNQINTNPYNGYYDEFRISKDVARFTPTSFTPPASEYVSITIPTVTTTSPVTNISDKSVNVAGNVSSDGGATITERGFVYATTANPTTANNKVTVSGTTGAISTTLTGLTPNTTYHVRAFATNSIGTAYGDDVSWTSQIRQSAIIEILEYQEAIEADTGTNASEIIYDGHGLSARDMIVNTTRRTTGAERGSRLVNDIGVTANTIPLETSIVEQVAGDTILLFKYIDRTDLVKIDTLRLLRRSNGQSELSFTFVTDNQYVPRVGSYIRMNWNEDSTTTNIFKGILRSATRKMASEAESVDKIFLDCRIVGFNNIATRRTIGINESAGASYGSIATKMVTDYLYQDGITQGTIDTGELLAEDWIEDAISISDVLDQCASKSSFQWFVDDIGQLNFYQDPVSIPDATYTLEDVGVFKDYRDLTYEESIENYVNKVFVVGGNDVRGNQIIVGAEEFTESTLLQETVGGTGVYGTIQRDGSVIESEYKTSEAGTTTTNITITGHGQSIGDIIWNYTRSQYRNVTAVVDANNFTVDSVTSQTTGDIIALFDTVNKIIKNTFKVQSNFLPATFTFTTRALLAFNPGEKLYVDIAKLRILTTYFAIEEVEIFHRGEWFARVKASLRDNSNFTTQRMPNYIDFFRGY